MSNTSSVSISPPQTSDGATRTVRVGESLKLVNGRAFKPSEWKKSGLPIVRIQNLNNPDAPFNYYEGKLPERFLLEDGDLLFAWSGTPGTSFGAHIWRGGKAWLNQHIFKVHFDETQFDKRYLQLAINRNLQEYIRAAHGGAGLAHITKGRFEESSLPCPPLDEQERIVAEIEKQFTRLDAGVASLKQVQTGLKRHRASVLKVACEGRLVPTEAELAREENRSYETGEQLLHRILKQLRETWKGKGRYEEPAAPDFCELSSLPEGWIWVSAEQLGDVQLGRQRSPKNRSNKYPTKYLRAANITENGIDLNDVLEMEFKPEERSRYQLRPGDLILSEASGSPDQVGKPAVCREDHAEYCLQNTVIRHRPVLSIGDYLLVVYKHYYFNKVFARLAGGVGINHLGAMKFSNIAVPLPPEAEQQRIVAEVDRRLSVTKELEKLVELNFLRAKRCRHSILESVFKNQAHLPSADT